MYARGDYPSHIDRADRADAGKRRQRSTETSDVITPLTISAPFSTLVGPV